MAASEASSNWFARFIALLIAIGAAVWLYENYRELPDYGGQMAIEKGVYQGPVDEALPPDGVEALRDRNRIQSF